EPNEANSWLTYDDPQGRFHLRHPQDMRLDTHAADEFFLVRQIAAGTDMIDVRFQPPTGNPQTDRLVRDPEYQRKNLVEEWKKRPIEIIPGPSEWLPESEWGPLKMKVYRFGMVFKMPTQPGLAKKADRIHSDFYLILLTRPESLFVAAQTSQGSPLA